MTLQEFNAVMLDLETFGHDLLVMRIRSPANVRVTRQSIGSLKKSFDYIVKNTEEEI